MGFDEGRAHAVPPPAYRDFIDRLRETLAPQAPRPGARAHALMAPRPRRAWPHGHPPHTIRDAAGLVVLAPGVPGAHGADGAPWRAGTAHHGLDTVNVVLTIRAQSLDHHRGQVSLPGGAIEPGESVVTAALREAEEEVGLARGSVEIVGALSPIDIPVSGFRLHPMVGVVSHALVLAPTSPEVAQVIETPLATLMAPDHVEWRRMRRDAATFDAPVFPRADVDIWGATAMVLAELLAMLGWPGPERRDVDDARHSPA